MVGRPRAGRAAALALCALAATGVAGGCGGGSSASDSEAAAKTRDLDILTRALSRENKLIAAAAAAGGTLNGRDAALGGGLLAAGETHSASLTQAIRKLGGTPHQPRKDYSDQVAGRTGRAELLALLASLGARVAAADRRAAQGVSDTDFRGLTQAVAVSDRQHADALQRALGAR